MLLKTIILGIFMTAVLQTEAEQVSFVGMAKEDVKAEFKENYRKFAQDNSIVKQQFNYLKYVNSSQTITWIIYFTSDDICTSTKKVCDYTEYDFVIKELNEKCKRTGDATWTYSAAGNDYTLTLEEKDWYFTVRESLE